MKKMVVLLLACLMIAAATAFADNENPIPKASELNEGAVLIYDFGENKLHAYVSADALGDTCYAIESADGLVLIESTAFAAKNAAWKAYLDGLNKPVAGKLMAFHPNGSDSYSGKAPCATQNALNNWGEGGAICALTDSFVASFGGAVAADHPAEAQIVSFGDTVTIAGLNFVIRDEGDDAYGIEIPALNCVYIHMMGSDVHNILTSTGHIEALKAELEGFDYDLVLTGHHAPEGRKAVAAKIGYLEKTLELANASEDAKAFMSAMNQAFPDYSGADYLKMTAAFLFPAVK